MQKYSFCKQTVATLDLSHDLIHWLANDGRAWLNQKSHMYKKN